MKARKILVGIGMILFSYLAFIACNNEDNYENKDSELKKGKYEKMDSFFGAKIGVLKNKEVQVVVTKDDILKFAKEALKDTKLDLKPFDYKIIEEKGVKYLRIYSQNNYVSTVELLEDKNNSLKVANTVCTSTACASGGGCIPNGSYCTACEYSNGLPGDCTRTTSG
ncbi:hypothetical protein [Flavobacterium sp.]|uniref:hypothetical protein n=1 Tax=Flavobacterium sp. TaxID=239 RepID=UPI0025BE7AED|nr:hypothetical protein [Flavobacterium sp.]